MNIVRQGPFYTIDEIEGMGDENSPLNAEEVEAAFGDGDLLPPEIISKIQTVIDKCFVNHLLKDDKPIAKFGSMAESYTKAIGKYRLAVLNALAEWQTEYEDNNGELGIELQGRVAYAMRYEHESKAPRPLLTLSYVLVLNMIFERIPNCIKEVSLSLYFYRSIYTCPRSYSMEYQTMQLDVAQCATSSYIVRYSSLKHDVSHISPGAATLEHLAVPTLQHRMQHMGLYVYIPRCVVRCIAGYCMFNSVVESNDASRSLGTA